MARTDDRRRASEGKHPMATAAEPKIDTAKAELAAEQAYAAAAAEVKAPEAKPAAVEAKPAAVKVAKKAAPKAAAKKAPAAKVAAVKAPVAKTIVKKPAAKKAAAKKTTVKTPIKAAAKKAPASFKDTIMTKTQNIAEDFTAKIQTAVAEAQDRAKAAFEKGNEVAGEYGEFAKGNVEALVESTKILAAGLQDLGKGYVAEGKSVLETVTADVKELAAVKSPADFFKLQGEILRRNFDAAVAAGSKNSEKAVKLANDAFAPIQDRVSLAIEKVKKAA
jgi:phasin family protein